MEVTLEYVNLINVKMTTEELFSSKIELLP